MTHLLFSTTGRAIFCRQLIILCCLLACGAQITFAAASAEPSPEAVVNTVINEVATDMRTHADTYEKDQVKLQAMVTQRVETFFNFPRIAKLAMARHWTTATEEQRTTIIQELQIQFIRSYAKTLFAYRNVNPQIKLQPGSTDTKASVKMNVTSEQGDSTTLFLRLEKTDNQWRIIDVTAEGISLVITARGQFSDKIATDGIDGLIQSLIEENRKNSP